MDESKLPSQEKAVLDFMRSQGFISQTAAVQCLGIYRLSARIYTLRQYGYKIKTTYKTTKNRYGNNVVIGIYHLEEG